MREKVLFFLRYSRNFNEGVRLYNELPGTSLAFKAFLNREGETERSRGELFYELSQAVLIPEAQLQKILASPVEAVPQPDTAQVPETINPEGDQTPEATGYKSSPGSELAAKKIREDYPFLGDPSCPPELKILIADKITAYHHYVKSHEELHKAESLEDQQAHAQIILANFQENRDIIEELEHYKTTGQILGKHPIFALEQEKKEIDKLNGAQLSKKRNALNTNISRNRSALEKAVDDEKRIAAAEKVEFYTKLLLHVDFRLSQISVSEA